MDVPQVWFDVPAATIAYPDQTVSAEVGPVAINSTGKATTVRNLTVRGRPLDWWVGSIVVPADGVVENCTAPRIIIGGMVNGRPVSPDNN